jgi:hypothetical protein
MATIALPSIPYSIRKTPEYQHAIEQMVRTAKAAGCPPDQIRNFALGGYSPTKKQWQFHAAARAADQPDGPTHIALGGPRGGAKSHGIMSQAALDDCQRFPGLDVLYLRLVQKAGRKALDQLRKKTIMGLNHGYNRNEGLISFPNGSQIVVGHFKNEGDIDKYIGIEYDLIVKEETTQLSQVKIDQLHGSLRTGKPGWRPRTYNAANPGGVGHADFRETFVIPWREEKEAITKFIEIGWKDNPFLNPEYIDYLLGLKGILGQLWRDGDWDVGAGTFFIHWDPEVHTIKPLDIVPYDWPMWVSMDWGWAHPCDIQWHTIRPDGAILTVSEFNEHRHTVKEIFENIKEITNKWDRELSDISAWIAGHDIFANKGSHPDGLTIADQFRNKGIEWNAADVDRINGAAQLIERLGNPKKGQPASWFVTENCEQLIVTMPNMLVDEKRPEDVLKMNASELGEGGDDPYDCARYGLMQKQLVLRHNTFSWRF